MSEHREHPHAQPPNAARDHRRAQLHAEALRADPADVGAAKDLTAEMAAHAAWLSRHDE